MVFSPRSRNISNLDVRINNTAIERVYDAKFLGVQIDAQLSWKKHIEYTCNKLSKGIGIILKARKKLHKAALIILCYSFAYPYLIYCNLVWGNTYSTNLGKINLLQKKIVTNISSSPYRAHTAPLLLVNRLLSVTEINSYIVGICMYNYIHGILPTTFWIFWKKHKCSSM